MTLKKQKIKKLFGLLQHLSLKKKIIIGVSLVAMLTYAGIFGISKQAVFSYSGDTCVDQFTFFPQIMKQRDDSGYGVAFKDTLEVAGHHVLSLKTCFSATSAPKVGKQTINVSPYGSWFAVKKYAITVGAMPVANASAFIGKTLPVSRPVIIQLTKPDEIFVYKLQLADKTASCKQENSILSCDIIPLKLIQGETYSAALIRYFGDKKVDTIGNGSITTLKALTLVNSSVNEGQIIYDKPSRFVVEYDKALESATAELKIKNGATFELVGSTISISDKQVIVTPVKELTRSSDYQLTLKKAESTDGSSLVSEYQTNFSLSGGPRVLKTNVGATGVARSGTIVVTFDQEIANTTSIAKLAIVQGLNGVQITKNGKTLVISYSDSLQCSNFSIQIKKGFESQYGVIQQSDQTFTGRTVCYSIQTIGYSVQGRAINAYIFGSGPKTILYTAAMHGNEQSGRLLMNAWIGELDTYAQNIPTGVQVVVIPSVNPDGVAANVRYNTHGIDLNRNYDTSDWQTDVQTVTGAPLPGGGGSAPGSEPETQALMAYTTALQPYLTMSYHSSASYAIANTCGNSASLADSYAKMAGYSNMTGISGAFSYQITGTYDDWICERLGLASVLIELATSTSSEFSRNKSALWAMARA